MKIIPHVDGSPQALEMVCYYMDIAMKGAWTGPVSLQLAPHALAPVVDLPVREVVAAPHLGADLTLGLREAFTTICAKWHASHL